MSINSMGIEKLFKKVGTAIGKQVKKSQINSKRNEEIGVIKEKYLSHRELVQIYKTYLGE